MRSEVSYRGLASRETEVEDSHAGRCSSEKCLYHVEVVEFELRDDNGRVMKASSQHCGAEGRARKESRCHVVREDF